MPRPTLTADIASDLIRNATRRSTYASAMLERSRETLADVSEMIADRLRTGGKILVFGNGGSAACAQHFAAEFTGKLASDRPPYPAIALTVDTSALTAIANDYGYRAVFARQVEALATSSDVVMGISTSGSSENVKDAIAVAKDHGALTISLTGKVDALGAEISLAIPLRETARVQEAHDLLLHELAQVVERHLYPAIADDASADRYPFVLDESHIAGYVRWLRASGQTLATTNGVFDLLHEGHRATLFAARSAADHLCVLVNSDESTKRLKGPDRPIRPLSDRIHDLQGVSAVDHVVAMPDDDPRRLLAMLAPDIHCKGQDYRDRSLIEAGTVEAAGGRIELLEMVTGYSTTSLVATAQGLPGE